MQLMKIDNILEVPLKFSIGDKDNLQILLPVAGNNAVENFSQELTAFLDGIQPRRPEK